MNIKTTTPLKKHSQSHLFCGLLISLLTMGQVGAIEVYEPYYASSMGIHADNAWFVQKKGFYADWVEIEITVSAERKLLSVEVLRGSGNEMFARQQIKAIEQLPHFLMSKKLNGKYAEGKFIHRADMMMIEENNPHYKDVIIPQITRFSSQIKSVDEEKKKYLLFVNKTHGFEKGKEVFYVKEVSNQGAFMVLQIDLKTVGKFDDLFIRRKASSYEQMDNKFLVSNREYRSAINKYQYSRDAWVQISEQESVVAFDYNQKAPFDQKTEYWFKRPKQKPSVFDTKSIFSGYLGELTLESYQGNLKVQATVLPSGKLDDIKLLKKSETKRLNEIVLEAFKKTYVIPAYKNHQPVHDEVVFDLEFKKRGE